MIDFEKALDFVGFQFIIVTLEMFDFGKYYVYWIRILLETMREPILGL